ncbi:hypothetical protein BDQ94DRAFT_136712 [Aspergillus welwitschiae]|uniref:Uncharacterized protein n=1 Tax=Aspergillus welwitschiae TaxID=1341132 RepID=A0A3F3QE99_9EURO|nr:hypothetical protein BDQ94DRAFT_136712 [Aspergillus welwitschiae]RDH37598.1 hypothetical protein BDQ94DRAFT_136712 [Aspergillus welwitschiae]
MTITFSLVCFALPPQPHETTTSIREQNSSMGIRNMTSTVYLNRTWSAVAASNWTGIEAIPTGSATKDDHFLRGSNIVQTIQFSI